MAEPRTALIPVGARRARLRGALRRPAVLVPAALVLVVVAVALVPGPVAGLFGHGDPRACDTGSSVRPPEAGHPLGFDVQGCDLWANVVWGARSSLAVGLLTTVLALAVAVAIGTIGGLGNRAVDWVLSRLTDVALGFPFLLGAIVVLASVPERGVLSLSLVLALFGWPPMARLMRSRTRQVRGEDFVLAARTAGYGGWRIATRYVLPVAIPPVIVLATVTVGGVIVAESTLTYLGIGLEPPAISWGLQLASAASRFQTAPHLLLPAVPLAVTVLALIALGDALRTAADPRRRL